MYTISTVINRIANGNQIIKNKQTNKQPRTETQRGGKGEFRFPGIDLMLRRWRPYNTFLHQFPWSFLLFVVVFPPVSLAKRKEEAEPSNVIRLFVIELASFLSSSSSFIFIFFKFLVVSACLYTRNRLFGHPGREPCRPYNPGRRPDQQFFSLFLWPVAQITREKGENKSRRPFVCRVGFALFLLLSTWRWIYPNTRTHIQAQGGYPTRKKYFSYF